MPTCSALGCSVRSVKGQVLTFKTFPRKDKRLRKIWIDRVTRPRWTPTKYSVLCELHFDSDQWEGGKEGGKRKLKKTAVPTVFHVEQPNHSVSVDHPYCKTGLRKIYDPTNQAKSGKLNKAKKEPRKWDSFKSKSIENSRLPEFEHVDVDADELSIFAPEFAGFEGGETDAEEVRVKLEPEDIQCTPDICMWPDTDEPDPIEMVDCCDRETNPFESEPCDDPLAISADDMLQMNRVVPDFAHTRKYLFVPKTTKRFAAPASHTATGEPRPVVLGEEARIKVVSPQRLLLPKPPFDNSRLSVEPKKLCVVSTRRKVNVVLPYAVNTSNTSNLKNEPSSSVPSPPKLQLIPKSVLSQSPEKSTVASYLRKSPKHPPKLTPAPSFGEQPKTKTALENAPRSLNTLDSLNSTLKTVPFRKFQEAPMSRKVSDLIERNSLDASAPSSDVKPVVPIRLKSPPSVTESQPTHVISEVLSLQGNKGIIKLQCNNMRLNELSRHLQNKSVIYLKTKKPTRPIIVHKQNVKSSDHDKRMVFLKSMENFAQLENISLEHEYSSNLSWKPLSLKGFKLKEDSLQSYFGAKLYPFTDNYNKIKSENCSLKPDNNKPDGNSNVNVESPNETIKKMLKRLVVTPVMKSSSMLLVNPYDKTKTTINLNKVNSFDKTELPPLIRIKNENKVTKEPSQVNQNMINSPLLRFSRLKLHKCKMCKFSFLTPASLQIHSDSHDALELSEGKEESSGTDTASTVTADETEDESERGKSTLVGSRSKTDTEMTEIPLDDLNRKPILDLNESGNSSPTVVVVPELNILQEPKQSLKKRRLKLKDFKGFKSTDLLPTLHLNNAEEEKSPSSVKEGGNNSQGGSSEVRYSLRRKNANSSLKPKTVNKRRLKRSRVKSIYAQKVKIHKVLKGERPLKNNPIVLTPRVDIAKFKTKEKYSEPEVPDVTDYIKLDKLIAEIKKEKEKSSCPGPKTKAGNLNKSKSQADSGSSEKKKPKPNNSLKYANTKCTICGMEVEKSVLNRHMMQHISVDINLYTCTVCNKKFSRSFQLRKHITSDHKIKTAAKDFKCPKKYCDRAFESKRMLYKHTIVSHKKK